MFGKQLGVDGGRSDNQLEIRPLGQKLFQITQKKIDVQAALVCLIDNQRVVAAQIAVSLGFGEQDAVGHHLNQIVRTALIGEAHLIAHQIAERRLQFVRHAARHRARGDAARLRTTDKTLRAALEIEANLGQLRGFAGAGLTRDHHHLMRGNGARNFLALGGDGEFFRINDGRDAREAGLDFSAVHNDENLSLGRAAGKAGFSSTGWLR